MYTRKFTKTLIMVLYVILFLGLVSCTPHFISNYSDDSSTTDNQALQSQPSSLSSPPPTFSVAPTYTPQPVLTRRWGIQYPTPDEVVPTYTPQPMLTPCSPNIEQDISYWKEFVVHDYGFSCKYPPGWYIQQKRRELDFCVLFSFQYNTDNMDQENQRKY